MAHQVFASAGLLKQVIPCITIDEAYLKVILGKISEPLHVTTSIDAATKYDAVLAVFVFGSQSHLFTQL